MKYLAAASLFLMGNEILSYLALTILALMFCADILKERFYT